MADLIQILRQMLRPQGTKPLVRLFMKPVSYYNVEFTDACIDEMNKVCLRHMVGQKPNPLERLAMDVLLDSAYLSRVELKDLTLGITENNDTGKENP